MTTWQGDSPFVEVMPMQRRLLPKVDLRSIHRYGSMQLISDPNLVALLYLALLGIAYFVMDIHSATRVLWNACGQIKDKVKHTVPGRTFDMEFEFLENKGGGNSSSPSDARTGWGSEPGSSPSRDHYSSDNGHFSYDEFLARFGSGNCLACKA
jgi:hypothetical protein